MAARPQPVVLLYRNPWFDSDCRTGTVTNSHLLAILQTAAVTADEMLGELIKAGEADETRVYACVLLDPTRPRGVVNPVDLTMAAVMIGTNPSRHLPEALAVADVLDRHSIPNGVCVEWEDYCLSDDDFAQGGNAAIVTSDDDYQRTVAVASGSGLTAEQDEELAQSVLYR